MNFNYPEALPVSRIREKIQDVLRTSQVVVVAGDTGSGKTTQLPKICLELLGGKGVRVGCTQPRRLAAMTVSARVAEELGEAGSMVGYKIRFQDRTDAGTRIKFMTDGVLLAETRQDPLLKGYDVLIIDEAHERSLNIDFLLGHLKNILARRPDLKVVITSATIDTDSFSRHFDEAPVISVPGRTYPVEVRYLPPEEDEFGDAENYVDSAVRAVGRLVAHDPPGDILVFLPTERDIRSCCELLGKRIGQAEVLPLFGRLHGAEQKRIFQPSKRTKIVVATNVAETSITVPGIRYVVDTGLARMAYYNHRSKTHSLPIRRISRASCDQRKGRCGRVGPGVCVRLYEEQDYLDREEFTTAEIHRSNLAEVILQMLSFKLGDPYTFPFIDPPHANAIKEGYNQLFELGALTARQGLTTIGRRMAAMPIDPLIARIIIAAEGNNCLREIMIIATVLAIQDPRVRPAEKEDEADLAHEQFADQRSDFLVFLNIWKRYQHVRKKTSRAKLKKFCAANYLSFQRMREWLDLHQQMESIVRSQTGTPINREDGTYEAIHQSLCAGFLRNIAMKKEGKLYTGASGKEVMIFPGSHQFHSGPPWLLASSFLATNRLYALNVAAIEPEWLEQIGKKLCRYSWSNPRYQKRSGQVVADEHVHLFGLPIIASRRVNYGRTTPGNREEARAIFIQSALVEDNLAGSYPFLDHNRALLEKWENVEDRLRVRDIVVGEEVISAFYDDKLPPSVYDRFTLNRLLKKKKDQDFLKLSEADIAKRLPAGRELADFPATLRIGSHDFKLEYQFDPTSEADGVTVHIPAALIETLKEDPFQWLVPGLIREKTTHLLKSLPKRIRKQLIPLNITVDRLLDDMAMSAGSYYHALEASIFKHFKISIGRNDWTRELPRHLRMRFAAFDLSGREIMTTRDFAELQALAATEEHALDASRLPAGDRDLVARWEAFETSTWDFDELPASIPLFTGDREIAGFLYPALTPTATDTAVRVRFVDRQDKAAAETRLGLHLLYRLQFREQFKALKRHCRTKLSGPSSLWLVGLFKEKDSAVNSLLGFILDTLFETSAGTIPTRATFTNNVARIRRDGLFNQGQAVFDEVMALVRKRNETLAEITRHEELAAKARAFAPSVYEDYRRVLAEILPPDFLSHLDHEDFENRKRYMQGLIIRINRGHADMTKDSKKAERLAPHERNLSRLRLRQEEFSPECREKVQAYATLLQEMRISLFAPELKTAVPVSEKKLARAFREITERC